MKLSPKQITLKNGGTAILRSPTASDAEGMLDFLRTVSSETEFLLRSADECDIPLDREVRILEDIAASPQSVMILCEVGGKIAGNCSLNVMSNHKKTAHRASVGIALRREFWSLGIGTAMFGELIAAARELGVTQLELEFFEGNSRARALYEKQGFRIVGVHPNAVRLSDGKLYNQYFMIKEM